MCCVGSVPQWVGGVHLAFMVCPFDVHSMLSLLQLVGCAVGWYVTGVVERGNSFQYVCCVGFVRGAFSSAGMFTCGVWELSNGSLGGVSFNR